MFVRELQVTNDKRALDSKAGGISSYRNSLCLFWIALVLHCKSVTILFLPICPSCASPCRVWFVLCPALGFCYQKSRAGYRQLLLYGCNYRKCFSIKKQAAFLWATGCPCIPESILSAARACFGFPTQKALQASRENSVAGVTCEVEKWV